MAALATTGVLADDSTKGGEKKKTKAASKKAKDVQKKADSACKVDDDVPTSAKVLKPEVSEAPVVQPDTPTETDVKTNVEEIANEVAPVPLSEYLDRRRKNLSKRKGRIDALLEADPSSLNADQRNSIRRKEAIDAALHEVEEAEKVFLESSKYEAEKTKKEIAAHAAQHERELEAAALESKKALRKQQSDADKRVENLKKNQIEQLGLTVKFLRLASLLRVEDASHREFSFAVEKLLHAVYEGNDASVKILQDISTGHSSVIYEDDPAKITYEQLKDLCSNPNKLFEAEEKPAITFKNGSTQRPNGSMLEISFFPEDSDEESSSPSNIGKQLNRLNKSESNTGPSKRKKKKNQIQQQ